MKWKYIVDEEVKKLIKEMRPIRVHSLIYDEDWIRKYFGSKANLFNLLVVGLYVYVHPNHYNMMKVDKIGNIVDYTVCCYGRKIVVEFWEDKVKIYIDIGAGFNSGYYVFQSFPDIVDEVED